MTENSKNMQNYETVSLADKLTNIMVSETQQENGKGLSLIDIPTGYGKTYAAENFIPKFLMDPANKDRCIFFIAPQIKELPSEEEMVNAFEKSGCSLSIENTIMWVKSLPDMIAETANASVRALIPNRFTRYKETKKLFEVARKFNDPNNAKLPDYKNYLYEQLRQAEIAFRKRIQRDLERPDQFAEKSKKLTRGEQLRRIKYESDWQWLGRLYPTVFTRERRVFFMTVDKFICPHATLVEPSFCFTDDKMLNDAVVIMDEFDSSKDVLLNSIISKTLNEKVDMPELLRNLHSGYEYKEVPSELLQSAEASDDPDYAKRIFKEGQRVCNDIFNSCKLCMNFKNDTEDEGREFIFYDGNYRFTTQKSFHVLCDENDKINRLIKASEKKDNDNNLALYLGNMRGGKNFLLKNCMLLANTYMQSRNEGKTKNEAQLSLESAQRTVLDHLGIKESQQLNYMLSGMRNQYLPKMSKGQTQKYPADAYDLSVYRNGVHFITLVDGDTHEMSTRIEMCELQNTPEQQLLKMAEKARIIGISATASLDSALCNYDLDYIESQMTGSINRVSMKEKSTMRDAVALQNSGYDQVKIVTELISGGVDEVFWKQLFNDDYELSKKALNLAKRSCGSEDMYIVERYARITGAFRYFILHPEIQSFLCLTMAACKQNSVDFEDGTLKEILILLLAAYKVNDIDLQSCLKTITGSKDFEEEYATVRKQLASGERVFLMTAYGTAGTGVNLQYPSPEGRQVVEVFERPREACKDYDAIYVDLPTNVAPYVPKGGVDESSLMKSLFEVGELVERGEISRKNYKCALKGFSLAYAGAKDHYVPSFKQTKSARAKVTKFVNQGIGRMSRTNHKSPSIHILADKRLADQMDLEAVDLQLSSPEFSALATRLKKEQTNGGNIELNTFEEKAAVRSQRMTNQINRIVNKDCWREEDMAFWKEMRKVACKFPTISQPLTSDKKNLILNTYAPAGKKIASYTFREKQDFRKVDISFERNNNLGREVSEKAARLPKLMRIPCVREHFENEGYATTWQPGDFILTPTLFNNVYLGALGEQAGLAIFSSKMGIL